MSRLDRQRAAPSSAFALLVLTLLLATARADEPEFKPIFNGKDLTGWRIHPNPNPGAYQKTAEVKDATTGAVTGFVRTVQSL